MSTESSPPGWPERDPASRYPGAHVVDQPPTMGLGEIVGVLRRRWWLVVLFGALSTAATFYVVSQQTPVHQAEALIRLRDRGAGLAGAVLGASGNPGGGGANPFLSEIMVIQGRALAGDVVDREGLRLVDPWTYNPARFVADVNVTLPPAESQEIRLAFGTDSITAVSDSGTVRAGYGMPVDLAGVTFVVPSRPAAAETTLVIVPRERMVDWMSGRVVARQRPGTDVVSVTVTTPGPRLAVRLVNAVVESHRTLSALNSQQEARARRAFIDTTLLRAESDLLAAQSELERFRQREQVYRSDQRAVAAHQARLQLEADRSTLGDERRVFRGLIAELERPDLADDDPLYQALNATPAIARSPIVSQLVARLTQQQILRDSLLIAGVSPTHDRMRELDRLMPLTRARITAAMRTHVEVLDEQLAGIEDRLERYAADLRRLSPTGEEEVKLIQEVDRIRAQADQLRGQKDLARIAEATALGNVEIIERATRSIAFVGNRTRTMVLGLAIGVFLGIGLAFLLENLNTSIHRRSELEAILHAPGLAVIPRLPRTGRGLFGWARRDATWNARGGRARKGHAKGDASIMPSAEGLVTVTHSADRGAEAYRTLRTKLLYLRDQLPLRTLMVTSAALGEGKTTTAANVATALAQLGVRVLLIDCDLRRPRLHALFGITRAPGLTDLLKNTAPAALAIRPTSVEGLHVLPRGTGTKQPAELLGGGWMVAALRELASHYEMVILDSPPLLSASETASLAGRVDGVLFVARAGATHRNMAREAVHQLEAVGATVVGTVLNDPDAQVPRYESYGYGYLYEYPYQS